MPLRAKVVKPARKRRKAKWVGKGHWLRRRLRLQRAKKLKKLVNKKRRRIRHRDERQDTPVPVSIAGYQPPEGAQLEEQDTILHKLYRSMLLDGEGFVRELHRQVLHRDASDQEAAELTQQLSSGTDKVHIAELVMLSEEAQRLYEQPFLSAGRSNRDTIGAIINQAYASSHLFFVHFLYYELLSRLPEESELRGHMEHLVRGVPRSHLIRAFLLSEECRGLLSSHEPPRRPVKYLRNPSDPSTGEVSIGIFMGFPHVTPLDGEGIGRFSIRLIDGMLSTWDRLKVYITTTETNYDEYHKIFARQLEQYAGRLVLMKSDSMETINRTVPVHVWLVPYVGLELAVYLQRPYVLCLHDLVYLHFKELYFRKSPEFCDWMERVVYRMAERAAAVVFNSDYIKRKEGMEYLGLQEPKTQVIRLASPQDEYNFMGLVPEAEFRIKYGLADEYIVFPSVIRFHKNHSRLIESFIAYKKIKPSRLQLVITDQLTPDGLNSDLYGELGRYPAELLASVRFIGRLPSGELPALYKYAKGTIVPTLFEGSCPFPILESLTMGTPVAAGRLEVTQEVIRDMEAFITFNPYSVSEMVAAIAQLDQPQAALAVRQQAAIQETLQRTWSHVAGEYTQLLEHVGKAN
ncbi:glycosyl transferase [Paenibacillus mucilaginosus K02]|uniref:Glycosyl transferase n=1 Tax=Paenibacillus mucilaginosus K02 TaxID=997761 RepID=I0BJU1_9BACL|nr:glycosyl transferase [Paenibacillus mucilaginosus K02]